MEETLKIAQGLISTGRFDEAAKILKDHLAELGDLKDFGMMVSSLESYREYVKDAEESCRQKKLGAFQQIAFAEESLEIAKELMVKFLEKFK